MIASKSDKHKDASEQTAQTAIDPARISVDLAASFYDTFGA
jgi:hypothetical protein